MLEVVAQNFRADAEPLADPNCPEVVSADQPVHLSAATRQERSGLIDGQQPFRKWSVPCPCVLAGHHGSRVSEVEPPRDVAGQISALGAGLLRSEPFRVCVEAKAGSQLPFSTVLDAVETLFVVVQEELVRPLTFARRIRVRTTLRLAIDAGFAQCMSEGELKRLLIRAAKGEDPRMLCIGRPDDPGCGSVFVPSAKSFRLAFYCSSCTDRTGPLGQQRRDRLALKRASGVDEMFPVWGGTFDKNGDLLREQRLWWRRCAGERCGSPMTVIYKSVDLCAHCGGSGTPV